VLVDIFLVFVMQRSLPFDWGQTFVAAAAFG
jgi:hypothetical protein